MLNDLAQRQETYFCKFTFGQFVTFATLEIAMLFFVFYLGARFGPEIAGLTRIPPDEAGESASLENPRDILEAPPDDLLSYTGRSGGPLETAQEPTLRTIRTPSKEASEELSKSKQNVLRIKSSEHSRYSVQVGSYPTVKEGTSTVEKWQRRGYEAFMTLGEIPGRGVWYRVRIGNFGSKEEAEKIARDINSKEQAQAIVVAQES